MNDSTTNWGTAQTFNTDDGTYIGTSHGSDVVLWQDGGTPVWIVVFIDQSDSYKLKCEVKSAPSTSNFHFIRLRIEKGPRKTAADVTINS